MKTNDEKSLRQGKPIKLRQGQPVKFTPEPGGTVTLIPGKGVTRVQVRVQGAAKIEHFGNVLTKPKQKS